jgi:hypothetical protein
VFGYSRTCIAQTGFDGGFQAIDIILRMLSELAFCRITLQAIAPARIIKYCSADFGSVGGIHDDRADRIRAVINSYDISW